MTVATGRSGDFKLGKRVPIMIGILSTSTSGPSNQVEYLDIGLAIQAQVDGGGDALRVQSKIEQSAIDEEKSGFGVEDPVVRQTMLEGTVTLAPGKPVVLGSLEAPGSGKRQEVSVTAEAVE
jgi:type II secretory pathway component GspD/PulD (secretin)